MSLQDAILRIECSFLENSVATGCLVSLCHSNMKEQNNLCTNLSIMGSPTNSGVLSRNFRISNRKAVYVITNVAVIEKNGSIISIESLAPFGRLEVSADFEPVVTTVVSESLCRIYSWYKLLRPFSPRYDRRVDPSNQWIYYYINK